MRRRLEFKSASRTFYRPTHKRSEFNRLDRNKKNIFSLDISKFKYSSILYFLLFITVYYIFFWSQLFEHRYIISEDNRNIALGKTTDLVNYAIENRPWYEYWHSSRNMIFMSKDRIINYVSENLNESDTRINISTNIVSGQLKIISYVEKPTFVVALNLVTKDESKTKYISLNENGIILAISDTLRYKRSWLNSPVLSLKVSVGDLESNTSIATLDTALKEAIEKKKEEIKLNEELSKVLSDKINSEKLANNIITEKVDSSQIIEEKIPLMDKLTVEAIQNTSDNLKKNSIWKAFFTSNNNNWSWPQPNIELINSEAMTSLIEINEAVNSSVLKNNIKGYSMAWPEPDKIGLELFSGTIIYFSLEQSSEYQMNNLEKLLLDRPDIINSRKYIDLRFGEKVYIR